jgi:hypothetical protein
MWDCEALADAAAGTALEIGLPTAEQSALVSPTSPACVPQDHLELVSLERLAELKSARVERGTELLDADVSEHGVGATLRDGRARCARATSSPPTARTAACAGCSTSRWRGPTRFSRG